MKIIILTAGSGRRLGMYKPKSLVNLNNKTLLNYQLIELAKSNIFPEDIYLVTGYKNELFNEFDLPKFVNRNYAITNQIFSITCANKLANEQEVLIVYGDILFRSSLIEDIKEINKNVIIPSYSGFKELWKKRGDINFDDLESFRKDSSGILKEIGNNVIDINNVNGQFMGVLCFKNYYFKNFLNKIDEFRVEFGDDVFMKLQTTEFLNYLIKKNEKLFSFDYSDYFIEIDNKNDLDLAKKTINF